MKGEHLQKFYEYDALLSAAKLIDLVDALDDLIRSGAHRAIIVPLRETVPVPGGGACLSMPAISPCHGIYINKVATIFPRHADDLLPRIHALVAAFSTVTGESLALLDGAAVTNLKCAAVSALVTRYCAAEQASVLAVIGAGVQARQQVTAVCAVRPIQEIRLFTRDPGKLVAFSNEIRSTYGERVKVVQARSVDHACEGAEIVGTATASDQPIGCFENLSSSIHINCMGAHTTESRELPPTLLERALLIVEDVPTAIAEAGEYHRDAVDLGRLVQTPVQTLRNTATVFSSTGHAFLDAATVAYLLSVLH